jgi:acetolactate synthase I/II/III large subunit
MSAAATVADVMAGYVEAAGVRCVFGYPGDPNIEFMEQCRRRDIDVVLARREGSAGFMAEAGAMLTGRPGVCLSTLGPGSTALVNPVAAAYLDRVPMLAISGQIATHLEASFTHQVVDHNRLFAPITKWAGRIEAGAAATTMRKALRTAVAERPGPVHLTCAADVATAPATDAAIVAPPLAADASSVRVHRAPGGADPQALLAAARRPVILAGIGATRCSATDALVRLAEAMGAAVVVAPMAKGVFPEDHSHYAGVIDMACNRVVWDLLGSADLIVAAGFDAVELIKPWRLGCRMLHIDTTPNTDQIYAAECEVVGDIAVIADWLAEGWRGEPRWSAADLAAHQAKLREAYYAGRVAGRLNPTDVVDAVHAATGPGTVVTTDVGSHKILVGQGWRARGPRSVLMTNGLSSMGFGLPAAIAAKYFAPDRTVVAMVGDGGFAMAQSELRLAAARGLAVVVVVFVDGSLNRIEIKQKVRGYPSTATRIEDTDLVGLAQAMSCDGIRVETVGELDKGLSTIDRLTRPLVVEACIDPSQYESQF